MMMMDLAARSVSSPGAIRGNIESRLSNVAIFLVTLASKSGFEVVEPRVQIAKKNAPKRIFACTTSPN